MTEELEVRLELSFSKSGVKIGTGKQTGILDVSGDYAIHNVQAIGFAAAEALSVGEITTAGYAWFHNIDSTNYVEIGYDDSGFKNLIKLKAGEQAIVRLGQDAPYAQADTASVDLEYVIIED